MRAWEIREWGMLTISQLQDPQPGPFDVVLRMKAASLNYRDLLMLRGRYDPRQPLPLVPVSDGVGEVVAVGPAVTRVQLGDRVSPIFAQRWHSGRPSHDKVRSTLGGPLPGVLSEYVMVHEEGVAHLPGHLSDEACATLPVAALTAWNALVKHGELVAGETVLIQGSGGVALFAMQFARALGARVMVTSSSDEKLQRMLQLGADDTINYVTQPAWGREARAKSGGVGVDLVVEVGGAGTLEQSIRALRIGGRISLIGNLAGASAELNILPILMGQLRIQGVLVGSREDFEQMNRAMELHQLQPVIDQVFSFNEAPMAFDHLQRRRNFGKVCIRF